MGYPSHFTIYDADDAKNLIKSLVKDQQLDDKLYKPNNVYSRISAAKNSLMTPTMYLNDPAIQQEDARSGRPLIGQLYEQYASRCFKNGAMDFDDLLLKMYQLLISFPDALAKYQHKFRYILIDEYQDTNMAQYKIIKLLGAVHENICVVGDDAQSIYSFRGATIENILKFQHDYDDVKVVKLEQNYRSTQSIISAANQIIGNNKHQIKKNLWTSNEPGDKIRLVRTMTDNDEGRFVADAIAEQRLRNHYKNGDFAILYRTNAQSRSFEESLRRHSIPYRIYGGLSFYQRKEVKDMVAYLRITANPQDDEALKRIVNYPARGIGKTSMERLTIFANENGLGFWESLQRAAEAGLKGAGLNAIEQFVLMIRTFQSMLRTANAYELAYEVGKLTGLVKELYNDKSVEGLARYENVQELLNSIKEFTETPNADGELDDNEKSLGTYLQQITLLTDADKDAEGGDDVVKLMTIHAAKGLEFPCVFAVGLEENIFPSAMSLYDREDLEEERRLFYVVVTRAKDKLWISFANSRYRFGNLVQNDPSRFIQEVPEEVLDTSFAPAVGSRKLRDTGTAHNRFSNNAVASNKSGTPNTGIAALMAAKKQNEQSYQHKANPDFQPTQPAELAVGDRVEHNKFGFGTIRSIDGAPQNRIAHIDFEQGLGSKKIMLSFAKLMKVI